MRQLFNPLILLNAQSGTNLQERGLEDIFGAGLQNRTDDLDEEETEDADEEEQCRPLAEDHRQGPRILIGLCRAHGRSPDVFVHGPIHLGCACHATPAVRVCTGGSADV